jgi:hypothetical protein
MNSGIDFVLYLGPQGSAADDQCRSLVSSLNPTTRSRIKCMDFAEIVRSLGPKKPAWLRGYPTLSSYESPPRVLEGSKVIATLTEWVQQQQQQASRQMSTSQGSRQAPAHATQQQQPTEVFQSSSMGVGMYATVVDDTAYVSQMASKSAAPGRGGSGKITQAEIDSYNMGRR